jgi:hypothetical protein
LTSTDLKAEAELHGIGVSTVIEVVFSLGSLCEHSPTSRTL